MLNSKWFEIKFKFLNFVPNITILTTLFTNAVVTDLEKNVRN